MWFENQFPYFLWMILCGTGIMFFYDFLRISRRVGKCSALLVNLEDVLFSCICAVVVFYVTYLKNNGELRIQTILGLLTGCVIYVLTVKDRFVKIGTIMLQWIGKVILRFVKVIFCPIAVVCKIVVKPARIIIWYTGRGCKSIKHKTELKMKNIGHILRRK